MRAGVWSVARVSCAIGLASIALLALGCRKSDRATSAQGLARSAHQASAVDSSVRAPDGVRIKVEVLNATRNRGVARRVTLYLRDRGFDVVAMGNSGRLQSNTVVLDRSKHPEWAGLIAKALRADSTLERPDSSRYLDATVLIGTDWAAPALPFYP